MAERPGKEFKNMADKSVVTATRRQKGRLYEENGRHNLIHIYFQLQMKREPPKTDKNRQMLLTMGSTKRKSEPHLISSTVMHTVTYREEKKSLSDFRNGQGE